VGREGLSLLGHGHGDELSQFLTSRRAKPTPEQVGLRSYGRRQVPGLRREEVASLAGVSVEYYKRLERGNAAGVSDSVLDALADALQLDDAERTHLFELARAASPVAPRQRRRASPQQVRPVVQRIVDSIGSPATVSNMRGDYLTANALGRALYAPLFDSPEQPPTPRVLPSLIPLLSASSPTGTRPRDLVAALRSEAGRNPHDGALPSSSRAVDPQRAIPEVVGRAQRPLSPDRSQAAAPSHRRRPRARLRGHGALGR
jgi:transcriptional regulator with XRE-family HTH domain